MRTKPYRDWIKREIIEAAGLEKTLSDVPNPLMDASEVEVHRIGRDGIRRGRITLAGGYANHGETVRLLRDGRGRATELWLGSGKLLPEAKVVKELGHRYDAPSRPGG